MKVSAPLFRTFAVTLPLLCAPLHGAEDAGVKAPALAKAKAESKQGLALTISSGGKSDTRDARLAALFVPAGQAATPFVPAGQFTAKWEGAVDSPLREEYTFSADVLGTFKVSLNGKSILEGAAHAEGKPVQLNKGENKLLVEYQSPASGDAMFRLNWASKDFPVEPLQPTSVLHDSGAADLRTGERLREGRLLFAQLHCTACHDGSGLVPAKGEAGAMPELAQDAPVFAEFGARFNEAWLAHWINDPHSIRPRTPMPRVFATGPADKIDQRAADLAAYLVTMGARKEGKIDDDKAPIGGALFANFGCIACHTQPDFDGKDEFDRVPLAHLKAKWQVPALLAYLKDPQQYYQWTRMPNFRLTDDEAGELAAYLLSGTQHEFAPGPKGDPAKGAQLVVAAGCMNCHAGVPPMTQPKLAETVKHGWTRGCMAADAKGRGAAPDFDLTGSEREALLAFAATGFSSLKQDTPEEFLQRQSVNVHCTACHSKDGEGSVWSQLDNDMAPLQAGGPPPEGEGQALVGATAPNFTWLGERLKTEWAVKFVAGALSYKPRPWLIARMPGFGVRSEWLAQGLALDHGFPLQSAPEPPADPAKVKAGAALLGENGGFNCIACHAVGDRKATAVFEAAGINLLYAHERLRPEYYRRWVLFPLRIDPETKMPRFSDDTGKTPLTDFFGGDANQQFNAIWQYMGTLKK
jgi:mono/diheme cytochrome c family protein